MAKAFLGMAHFRPASLMAAGVPGSGDRVKGRAERGRVSDAVARRRGSPPSDELGNEGLSVKTQIRLG